MKPDCTPTLEKVIQIDEAKIHSHLGEIVRGTVEETLNAMRIGISLLFRPAS